MKIQQVTLDNCAEAEGLVVVIDVIRAFTTDCYAFEAGASRIVLVGEVEEALALKRRWPDAFTMGEVGGLNVEGFDYGNSPSALIDLDLSGRSLIHRSSSGTQGVVRSSRAEMILAASFACAGASAQYIQSLAPEHVTMVVTGHRPDGRGDEDAACADYLTLLLQGQAPDPEPYLQRVWQSKNAGLFTDPHSTSFPAADLPCCAALNTVDYALRVAREDGLHILRPVWS